MLNEQQIRTIFDRLNREYFFNSLPQPNRIEFKFVKKYLGQFHWDRLYSKGGTCVIRFSTAWQMTDFEIEKVLIHEMIHEWQWVVGHSDHHGYFFKHKAAEINRLSGNKYEIARLTNIENKVCLKDANKSKFEGYAITYEKDCYKDKILIAFCAKKSFHKIREWFPERIGVKNIHFYLVKGDIYQSFKKSVKCVHGYPVSKENFYKYENTFIKEI